jgi:hypothetical protein
VDRQLGATIQFEIITSLENDGSSSRAGTHGSADRSAFTTSRNSSDNRPYCGTNAATNRRALCLAALFFYTAFVIYPHFVPCGRPYLINIAGEIVRLSIP